MRGGRDERGAILLIVVGLVAVLTVLVTQALTDTQIAVRRATNTEDWNRAFEVARGGIAAAEALLIEDAKGKDTSGHDDLTEDWAQVLPPFPVEDGVVAVKIEDGNRYFNINSLVSAQTAKANQSFIDLGNNLMDQLALPHQLIYTMVDAVDSDVQPRPEGGDEGGGYADGGPRNGWFDTDAEIWRLPGLSNPDVQKVLRPKVIAVDPGVDHLININTAPVEVVAAVLKGDRSAAEQLVRDRQDSPFKNKADIASLSYVTDRYEGVFDVKSDLFRISATARFGRAQATVIRWVRRTGAKIVTIRQEVPLW